MKLGRPLRKDLFGYGYIPSKISHTMGYDGPWDDTRYQECFHFLNDEITLKTLIEIKKLNRES